MTIHLRAHLRNDCLDYVHGTEEVLFELISDKCQSAVVGRKFLDGPNNRFTRTTKEDVDFPERLHRLGHSSLALSDSSGPRSVPVIVEALYLYSKYARSLEGPT